MGQGLIRFSGEEDWSVTDLYQFFHHLNILYNRLYVLKMDSARDSGKLKQLLDNSLSYVKSGDVLQIESLEIRSPALFSLKGIGEVIREIREFVKDVSYRTRLEKREKELELEYKEAVHELDMAIKRTKLISDQVNLLKNAGFTEAQIQDNIRKLTSPAGKMFNIMTDKNVQLIDDKKR